MSRNSQRRESSGLLLTTLWKSPWTLWMGLRYLRSKKNSRFMSLITVISVAGIVVGVTALIVVLSVMDGFEDQMKKSLISTDLHILIEPTEKTPGIEGGFAPTVAWKNVQESLKRRGDQIAGAWPVLATEVILKTGRKVTGVALKGVGEERLKRLKKQMVEVAESPLLVSHEGAETVRLPSVFIGQELAFELSAIPGDLITLVSPTETEGPLSAVPRVKRYVIEGVYRAGGGDYEMNTVFAAEASVRSFLRRAPAWTSYEIAIKDFEQAREISAAFKKELPAFRVRDWTDLNAHLFASLKLERVAMFLSLLLIVVVASFNIVTTLTLMVLEKKREIAIIKTMGALRREVAAIFLAEGIFIGLFGVFGGILMGGGICWLLHRYEWITLPDVYVDRILPVSFVPEYYLLISGVALAIVMAACVYPSRRAARLRPLEGLRS